MDEIWANRLAEGTRRWAQVPAARRAGVKTVLRGRVAAGTIPPEVYREITGEAYQEG